jgi:hypothetical protein
MSEHRGDPLEAAIGHLLLSVGLPRRQHGIFPCETLRRPCLFTKPSSASECYRAATLLTTRPY